MRSMHRRNISTASRWQPILGWRAEAFAALLSLLVAGCAPSPATSDYRLTALQPPGPPLHGIHGLRFGARGALYATSVIGQSIFRVNTATGMLETVVGPPEGMADDLAFAGDGAMVWTAIEDGIVYAKPPDGPIRHLLENRRGVAGISFSPDGKRLYVSLIFYGDALYELDVGGRREPRLIDENLGGLKAFDVGDDGMIYGPLLFTGKVVKIDPDSGAMTTISEDFTRPGALKLDSKGSAYVVDGTVLKRLDLASGQTTASARMPFEADNLAIAPDGRVFVSLTAADAIATVDLDTGAVQYVTPPAALTSPSGLAVATEAGVDTVYVGDLFGGVRRLNGTTGAVLDTPAIGLFQPSHVSIHGDHLIAVSQVFGTVQRIDRHTFKVLDTWEGFSSPGDALEAPNGDIIVADTGTGRVLRVTGPDMADREPVAGFLQQPTGLALATDGTIYVTETASGRVFRAVPGVRWSFVAEGLSQPEGLALDDSGNLYVMEVGAKRLTRINPSGSSAILAEHLPVGLTNGPSLFRGVAVSPTAIYFSSDVDNTVYRLTRSAP